MANNQRVTKEDLTENATNSVQTDLARIVTTREQKESRKSTENHIVARKIHVVKGHLIAQKEIDRFQIGRLPNKHAVNHPVRMKHQ